MSNTFTAIFERDGEWTIAHCPEIPGANEQGRTKQEARDSLVAAIALILQDRREDALRGLPDDTERETASIATKSLGATAPATREPLLATRRNCDYGLE